MSSLQAPPGLQPSASYSFTMRIELRQLPGAFAQVAAAIGQQGAILGAIERCRPQLVVCGHVNESWGRESAIGDTPVVNLGPEGRFFDL